MSPVYESEQRLARLRHLRNEVDLEIRQIERDLARRNQLKPRTAPHPVDPASRPRAALVRRWAITQGIKVGHHGRLPQTLFDAYAAAHATTGKDHP